jgi:hypothetical protein
VKPALDGLVAIVTGASSGLGLEFASALADDGAEVVAIARRKDRLEALSAEHRRIRPWPCDITDEVACTELVRAVAEEYGRIDILVNNAGVSKVVRAEDDTADDFRRLLEVNLVAPFLLSKLVAPTMINQRSGSIVNIASITGMVGLGRMPQAGYSASKGGLISLTRELAAQWSRYGIRVNAIAPGFFATEMTADLFNNESGRDWVARFTPMQRGGNPGELAGALLYLANPANSYTTGVVLAVDGGWTAV